jgi:hypothetical protein
VIAAFTEWELAELRLIVPPPRRTWSGVTMLGRVSAIDTVNSVKDYANCRQLVEARCRVDVHLAADPAVPLRDLIGLSTHA